MAHFKPYVQAEASGMAVQVKSAISVVISNESGPIGKQRANEGEWVVVETPSPKGNNLYVTVMSDADFRARYVAVAPQDD